MTSHYDVPGVYIEEQTGPGVITGVGTSTAAFIGPALRGQINEARRISSFDEFLEHYGSTRGGRQWPYIYEPRHFYMAHAVRGFFQNGGRQAYIVRVGTGLSSSLPINNNAEETVFIIQAQQEGADGDDIQVEIEREGTHRVAFGTAKVTGIGSKKKNIITVDDASPFRENDVVTKDNKARAMITRIQENVITLDKVLQGLSKGDMLRIADIMPGQTRFRLIDITGLKIESIMISGVDADNNENTERVSIRELDKTGFITLTDEPTLTKTYSLDVATKAVTVTPRRVVMAVGNANVKAIDAEYNNIITVDNASPFRKGDIVTKDNNARAMITRIQENVITLDKVLQGLSVNDKLRIANIKPKQATFRVNDVNDLYPGGVVLIEGKDANKSGQTVTVYAIVDTVDSVGFVTVSNKPGRTWTFNLDVEAANAPVLIPQEFRLIIFPPNRPQGRINNLSIDPFHPRYIFNETILNEIANFDSTRKWIRIVEPEQPPDNSTFPERLVAITDRTPLTDGQDDQPTALTADHYQAGMNVLLDIDDVNIICIPDASSHPERKIIQNAMKEHCLELQDRFAILDSVPGAPPSGTGSVEDQRKQVEAYRGFAALYYPWLEVRDPTSTGNRPRSIYVPPSGHVAGIFARTDAERGVHKAPANTSIRGISGLERRLSDGQHGPLNEAGINVLRIFPGTAQVAVWGARTTVNRNITDWLYINVRRLMLYIEESIEEGIRWAIFEPNNFSLWQKLKRTINEFLTRVWRDGALLGETADKAFYVRIDEALNPPSTMAIGRLYIEIGVAPVRPAEFIIVRIGLWEGGAEITE